MLKAISRPITNLLNCCTVWKSMIHSIVFLPPSLYLSFPISIDGNRLQTTTDNHFEQVKSCTVKSKRWWECTRQAQTHMVNTSKRRKERVKKERNLTSHMFSSSRSHLTLGRRRRTCSYGFVSLATTPHIVALRWVALPFSTI